MLSAHLQTDVDSRQHSRLNVHCRARIRIGKREYAGFLMNISEGGARIFTQTPIRETGPVLLKLPDLPPRWGMLRWIESHGGGVSFQLKLDGDMLEEWARLRTEWLRAGPRPYHRSGA